MLNTSIKQGSLPLRALIGTLIAMSVQASAEQQAAGATLNKNAQSASVKNRRVTSTSSDEPSMMVTAPLPEKKAGSHTRISAEQMQQIGGDDFGTIMRYQPLVSATGVSGGSAVGKSGFDRGGYTGYNIRGLESNRVGIDVDGIPLPNATGRSYASRAGVNTFGIGRDYIDPYMYRHVDIAAGATSTDQANTAIGGTVSFAPKSADDFLHPGKDHYFGYQSDYDSASRSWHNGLTAAAGDSTLRGIFVFSRRDGQQTQNNSGILDAYPANWHSNALMASAIWQPDDRHKLTGTADYYHKTNHTHYDTWDTSGNSIIGTSHQQSDTRRLGLSLRDEWSPFNNWVDTVDTRLFWQQTQAHDNTLIPTNSSTAGRVYSDYNVDTLGVESRLSKNWGRHDFSAGANARFESARRPFRQEPAPSTYSVITRPQADSRTTVLGGFVQDNIHFDVDQHNLSLIPGVRVVRQQTRARNLSEMTANSSVLTEDGVSTLYGKSFSDTRVLPSLTLSYDLTPTLMTYLQYKRGTQFPDASQLYGSWNLGASYAGQQQYALIGNTDLKTESSNDLEWGLKGTLTEGVTFSSALFYNDYDNFIAYTRYTRAASPEKFTNVPANIYTAYRAENRDKAYIYGGELTTRIHFGTWFKAVDGLSATLAYGYSQGKAKSSYLGDKYVDLDSVPPMKAVLGLAWDDPARRYGAAITATFVKGKQAVDTNREAYNNSGSAITSGSKEYDRVPGYGLVDLSAWWQVLDNVKLSGGIYNLTDRKYWDYLSDRQLTSVTNQDGYDKALAVMPGRTFQLGVNVDF
ncbi:TonB-dependent receptor [Erwinia sp. OLTSP20]|uniref:TonB-dependent receptor domain-containing protein n=1 Tax=unclassified Erwinia TaxID=2622719 RepID=UPI000C19C42E|nr:MULTISPECIES: TonB-dependent receptor [unclassified Erwinia]PIJ50235.1 TonB-dependent receptor [Erwinia sp. OAMSP11]PIJ72073.1 TonB-dependent receptor [Erwinia sp. OLSSP12]PIJ81364.1 TonB-dependent receptor [Erwinia sp. OLCASP19]PIJ84070.1 TonB-dependent receptor [Erwinia sp. OLMTSP26]PIJ85769.1 TonB-dependent receptor [Erwinia sp. OLMDSP33]